MITINLLDINCTVCCVQTHSFAPFLLLQQGYESLAKRGAADCGGLLSKIENPQVLKGLQGYFKGNTWVLGGFDNNVRVFLFS